VVVVILATAVLAVVKCGCVYCVAIIGPRQVACLPDELENSLDALIHSEIK
jgi:hypothetical protein